MAEPSCTNNSEVNDIVAASITGKVTANVNLRTHASGLQCVVMQHPSGARAMVTLHGANVIEWTEGGGDGKNLLFVSKNAIFNGKKAIRGGIPLVFPHFGNGLGVGASRLPSHGFARISEWSFVRGGFDNTSFESAPFEGS